MYHFKLKHFKLKDVLVFAECLSILFIVLIVSVFSTERIVAFTGYYLSYCIFLVVELFAILKQFFIFYSLSLSYVIDTSPSSSY